MKIIKIKKPIEVVVFIRVMEMIVAICRVDLEKNH